MNFAEQFSSSHINHVLSSSSVRLRSAPQLHRRSVGLHQCVYDCVCSDGDYRNWVSSVRYVLHNKLGLHFARAACDYTSLFCVALRRRTRAHSVAHGGCGPTRRYDTRDTTGTHSTRAYGGTSSGARCCESRVADAATYKTRVRGRQGGEQAQGNKKKCNFHGYYNLVTKKCFNMKYTLLYNCMALHFTI